MNMNDLLRVLGVLDGTPSGRDAAVVARHLSVISSRLGEIMSILEDLKAAVSRNEAADEGIRNYLVKLLDSNRELALKLDDLQSKLDAAPKIEGVDPADLTEIVDKLNKDSDEAEAMLASMAPKIEEPAPVTEPAPVDPVTDPVSAAVDPEAPVTE